MDEIGGDVAWGGLVVWSTCTMCRCQQGLKSVLLPFQNTLFSLNLINIQNTNKTKLEIGGDIRWSALGTHVAAAGLLALLIGSLQHARDGTGAKLLVQGNMGQPEAVDIGEVVACAPRALALHKGLGTEVSQAAAG
jgi:hypothetical protein